MTGDLNADPQTQNGQRLINLCYSFNYNIHVKEPTRITSQNQSILDQVITSRVDLVDKIEVLPPVSTNDHLTVRTILNIKRNIKCLSKKTISFGPKREKELLG